MHEKTYENIKIHKKGKSEISIEGEIKVTEMEKRKKEAIKNLAESSELPGFRKGKVPEGVIVSKYGDMHLLEEAAYLAISDAYPAIIEEHKVHVIGRPEVSFTKIAAGNPLSFKIHVAVFPEVNLPDYKKIAGSMAEEKETSEVTEKEVNDILAELQKSRAEKNEKGEVIGELPELNETFVKSFGPFTNAEDLKAKIKENLLEEKKTRIQERRRIKIGDELVKTANIDLPEIIVRGELHKMEHEFEADLKRLGLTMENYLKEIKKTKTDLETEWRIHAERKAKLQIILNKIALAESIAAGKEEISKEADHILEHHKDLDREQVENFVETQLVNEKVFQFLEKQK